MKQKNCFLSTVTWVLFSFAIVNLIVMMIYCFINQTVAIDEVVTLKITGSSFRELLLELAPLDYSPPLYHLYCKLVSMALTAITPMTVSTAAKLASVLPMIALVVVALTKVSKNWGRFCGGLFAFCITAMPQMRFYGIQIRMYALAMFLVTMTFLFAYDTAKKPCIKNFVLLAVFAVLSAYTHYYAVVAAAMIYLILGIWFLVHKKYKTLLPWFFSGLCVPALLAPWLIFDRDILLLAMQQSHYGTGYPLVLWLFYLCFPLRFEYGRVPIEQVHAGLSVVAWLIYLAVIGAVLYSGVSFLVRSRSKKSKENKAENKAFKKQYAFETYFYVAGFAVVAGVILVALITSVRQNTFIDRYVFPALGCFWLSFALCLGFLNHTTNLFNGLQPEKDETKKHSKQKKHGLSAFVSSKKNQSIFSCVLILCAAIAVEVGSTFSFVSFEMKQLEYHQDSMAPYESLQANNIVVTDSYLTACYNSYYSKAKTIYYSESLPSSGIKLAVDSWFPRTEYITDYTIVDTLMRNNAKLVLMFHSGLVPDEIQYYAKVNHYVIKEQESYYVGKRIDLDYFADDFTLFSCSKRPATPAAN
jgi:hypothetical protein